MPASIRDSGRGRHLIHSGDGRFGGEPVRAATVEIVAAQALETQGDTEGAMAARREFDAVWAAADMRIASSCQCIPEI